MPSREQVRRWSRSHGDKGWPLKVSDMLDWAAAIIEGTYIDECERGVRPGMVQSDAALWLREWRGEANRG